MKKFIVSILVFMMVLGNTLVFAESTANATMLEKYNYDIDYEIPEYKVEKGSGTHWAKVIVDPNNADNKVYGAYCKASRQNTQVTFDIPGNVGNDFTVIDFDYLNTGAGLDNDAAIQFLNSTGRTVIYKCEAKANVFVSNGTKLSDKKALANTWYHFTVVYNPHDSVKWYVDGNFMGEVSGDVNSLGKMRIYNRSTNPEKTVMIDNVNVRTVGSKTTVPSFNMMKLDGTTDVLEGEIFEKDLTGAVYGFGNETILSTDKGEIQGNKLVYTPSNIGMETVNLTATVGTESVTYPISINVIGEVKNEDLFEDYDSYEIDYEVPEYTASLGSGTHYAKVVEDPLNKNNKAYGIYCEATRQNTILDYVVNTSKENQTIIDFNYLTTNAGPNNDGAFKLLNNSDKDIYKIEIKENAFWENGVKTATAGKSNTWYHITLVFNPGNSVKTYVDNKLLSEKAITETDLAKLRVYNRTTSVNNKKAILIDNLLVRDCKTGKLGLVGDRNPIYKEIVTNEELNIELKDMFCEFEGEIITLTADKGEMLGTILSYTSKDPVEEVIKVTATNGKDTVTKNINVSVKTPFDVNIIKVGNGAISNEGIVKVKENDSLELTVTPNDGFYIESIRFNNIPVVAYQNGEYTYKTPAITKNSEIKVVFAEITDVPNVKTYPKYFTEVKDNLNSAYIFATARENLGEYKREKYGVLLTMLNLDELSFNSENKDVINAEGITAPNMLGQYGIEFTGKGLVKGNYYARPYGIYNGVIYYGDIVAFEVK